MLPPLKNRRDWKSKEVVSYVRKKGTIPEIAQNEQPCMEDEVEKKDVLMKKKWPN